jgi:hypothetical protein
MENQVPASSAPEFQIPQGPQLTPEYFAEMKRIALEQAIQQHDAQRYATQTAVSAPETKIIYVKRNLTVAELLLILLLSCGIVTGVQIGFNFVSDILSRIEIKER